MTLVPEKLKEVSQQIRSGAQPEPVTVRTFLKWFDAQRRGYFVVYTIRAALSELSLTTVPDFEGAYIDEEIQFLPAQAPTLAAAVAAGSSPIETDVSSAPQAETSSPVPAIAVDPTYRIGRLAAAHKEPLSVKPDASITEATTLMLTHGFSQLPVMQSERSLSGIVSWASVGMRLALGLGCERVADCMDKAVEKSSDESLFAVIPDIIRHQYVLIRGKENKITGIVTTSDLSLQFGQLAEPFLLLGEIEQHIRLILQNRFTVEDLRSASDPIDQDREISSPADLTFGEYIRLLENPGKWDKLKLKIDRRSLLSQLQEVRRIRNDVMHFDPDGILEEERETLRKFARFLQILQEVKAT